MHTAVDKAEFKARREICGLKQKDVANEIGVSTKTIKRWESQMLVDSPSLRASALMENKFSIACQQARELVESGRELNENGLPVLIPYQPTKHHEDKQGPDASDMCNQTAAAVAISLAIDNVPSHFYYPYIDKATEIDAAKIAAFYLLSETDDSRKNAIDYCSSRFPAAEIYVALSNYFWDQELESATDENLGNGLELQCDDTAFNGISSMMQAFAKLFTDSDPSVPWDIAASIALKEKEWECFDDGWFKAR